MFPARVPRARTVRFACLLLVFVSAQVNIDQNEIVFLKEVKSDRGFFYPIKMSVPSGES